MKKHVDKIICGVLFLILGFIISIFIKNSWLLWTAFILVGSYPIFSFLYLKFKKKNDNNSLHLQSLWANVFAGATGLFMYFNNVKAHSIEFTLWAIILIAFFVSHMINTKSWIGD